MGLIIVLAAILFLPGWILWTIIGGTYVLQLLSFLQYWETWVGIAVLAASDRWPWFRAVVLAPPRACLWLFGMFYRHPFWAWSLTFASSAGYLYWHFSAAGQLVSPLAR